MKYQNFNNDPLWQEVKKRVGFKRHLLVYILVNLFLWSVWLFSRGGYRSFWPIWTTLGWGIGILAHYINVYASFSVFSAEKEYERLKNKNL